MLNLAIASEKTLFEELWEYFRDTYFSADMPYTENFSVEQNALFSIKLVIIGITIGIIIASISTVYNKKYIGNFVRAMLCEGCLNHASAKTLKELGYHRMVGLRSIIKSGGSLSRWVRCKEEDDFFEMVRERKAEFDEAHKDDLKPPKFIEPQFKRNCDTMHFYIPEEKKYAADVKFEKQGNNFGIVIIVAAVSLVICAFLCYMLPDAIKMVDNFISVMNGNK